MMLHYYLNLPKDNTLSLETNKKVSQGILNTARRSFGPFEQYLQNVINVLEGKQEITATWKRLKSENKAQLFIKGALYKIAKKTVIKVLQNEKGYYSIELKGGNPDYEEKLICKIGGETHKFSISPEDYKKGVIQLPVEVEKFDRVSWGGENVELTPAWFNFQKIKDISGKDDVKYAVLSVDGDVLTLEGELPQGEKLYHRGKEIFYSVVQSKNIEIPQGIKIREDIIYVEDTKIKDTDLERIKDIASFITDHELRFESGDLLDAEREGTTLLFHNTADCDNVINGNKCVIANNIKFNIERLKENNKERYRIQLDDTEDLGKGGDIQTLSPLRFFFDDGVSAEVDKDNQYSITDGRESDYTLILKDKDKKFCFPPEGSILKVRVNTYPLRKQREAISTLKNMPIGDHARLIKLFENRNEVKWDDPFPCEINDWHIITDTNRSGYKEQREFVQKALGTRDFAILEGPPGSGKTTVILEIICQLAEQGKRVLLCASTHVAIDNILERLKEKKIDNKTLLEHFTILPVRIGDDGRIDEKVKEFQIDKLQKDSGISEELLLSSTNLVCGTTIGILQHPKFKQRNNSDYKDDKGKKLSNARVEPVIPEFDYLIIDESSKTTFQEFLVPALYAKKWILAGDVMQLSPYTERENIVSNLEHLTVDGYLLRKSLQDAIFYLHKLKDCVRYGGNRFVLPVPGETIQAINFELDSDRIDDFEGKIILFITENNLKNGNDTILIQKPNEINYLETTVADLIFVEENSLQDILPNLSERHAVLRSDKWIKSEHAFIHNAYKRKHPFSYNEIWEKEPCKDSFEIVKKINNYFIEKKSWAEEVAWRIDREFQFRRREKSKNKLTERIEELIPKSCDKVEDAVNGIAEIVFPSILESLVHGIEGRKGNVVSTISHGFRKEYLLVRRTTLVYQHRMHSDISKFPRDHFYKKDKDRDTDALKDLVEPKHIDSLRAWDYTAYKKYPSRNVWINVDGVEYENGNKKEVEVLMKHLKDFLQWAKDNKRREGNEESNVWEVACLTAYRRQEKLICEKLQALCNNESGKTNFEYREGDHKINIRLHTVDKFQGHEADVVFLSMVRTDKNVGFMDSPNRLNVAITRAKFQLLVFGKHGFFLNQNKSDDLRSLAESMPVIKG
jgi:RecA/RadA recombinase